MRKLVCLVAAGSLAVAGLGAPAAAGKKKKTRGPQRVERTLEAGYDAPALGSRDLTGLCFAVNPCPAFMPTAEERYLTLEVKDSLGQPVAITVGQDTDPSNATVEIVARTCGPKTEEMPIEPGVEVLVWIWAAPAANPPCPGVASSGTVTATFANLPLP